MKTQTKIAVTTSVGVLFLLSSAAVAEFCWPQVSSSSEKEQSGFVYTSANSPFTTSFSSALSSPHFSLLEQDQASNNAQAGNVGDPYLLKMSLPEKGYASLAFSIAYSPLNNLQFDVDISTEGTCLYDGAMLLLKDENDHQQLLSLDCASFAQHNYLDFTSLLASEGEPFTPTYVELEIHAHASRVMDYSLTELILNR